MEEIGVKLKQDTLKYLGAVENIFTFNGNPGHEIVLVYDGALEDPGLYDQAVILGKEANGEEICAMWKDLDDFRAGKSILYPDACSKWLNSGQICCIVVTNFTARNSVRRAE